MRKTDKYINYIETVLINKNIDNEDTEWQNNSNFLSLLNAEDDVYIVDSINMGLDVNELVLLVKTTYNTINEDRLLNISRKIEEKIKKVVYDFPNVLERDILKTINLLFFVESIQARSKLKDEFSSKKSNALIKQVRKVTKVKNPKINSVFYLHKDISTDEIKLPNIKRYEMVTLPPFDIDIDVPKNNKKTTLKGYVFTANLFDLVNLYNTIGDDLFKKNVRLGIDDKLDVDKSIKETLMDKPEAFWFRNNGVTILVEEAQMKLDRVGEIVLKEADRSEISFSVINGAQTITAASEYYYSISDEERSKKSTLAKVIVKIIHIRDEDPKSAEKEAKNISVSLNRQKPIKAEDIAFTNEFVETMNDYLVSSKKTYCLVRRGEEYSSNKKAYSLISFAKARKACAGNPGPARSNATATLLKINTDTSQFHDQEIFRPEWYSASEEERKKYYNAFYSPVLFAMDIAKECQSISKGSKLNDAIGNVVKNGMWYFIAYLVYLLNDKNDNDFSNFEYSIDRISSDQLKDLFEEFAIFYCKQMNATHLDTGSNFFKTSENYKKLKECCYEGTSFYQKVCWLFKNDMSINDKMLETNSPNTFATYSPKSLNTDKIQVVFRGVSHYTSSVSDAFIYTVQHCLDKAPLDRYYIALETLPFLTRNGSLETGSFRRKISFKVKNETIYIGKHSGNSEKLNQITRLCKVLLFEHQSILWKKGDSIIFEY